MTSSFPVTRPRQGSAGPAGPVWANEVDQSHFPGVRVPRSAAVGRRTPTVSPECLVEHQF